MLVQQPWAVVKDRERSEKEGSSSGPAPEPDGEVAGEGAPEQEQVGAPTWRRHAVDLAVVFVVSRVALTAVGLVSRAITPGPVLRPRPLGVGPTFSGFPFLDVWGEWDTGWYLTIAEFGYKPGALLGPFANYGFFPLYPLLARWLGWVVGSPFVGGLIVSNAALIVACVFLYRLVSLDDDVSTARRAVTYVFAAPVGFVFSAMLTESLYLALVIMCFYYARTERWWTVGALGFLLALSRGPGVFAAVPLLWLYLEQRRFSPRRLRPDLLALALLPAGVGVWMWFNERLTGDALAFTHIQVTAWGNTLRNPFSHLWQSLWTEDVFHRFAAWYVLGVLVFFIAFLRKFGVAYALFVLVSVVLPLAYGGPFAGTLRYTAVVFPLYVVAARVTAGRPGLHQGIVIAGAVLQGFLMSEWANNSGLVI